MAFTFHLPVPDSESQTFWDAAAEGRLLYQHCDGCGHDYHYPRSRCPRCWSADVAWREASGGATIYTYTVVRQNPLPPFRDRVPYAVGIVELAEGPRMMTGFATDAPEALRIGQRVEVVFEREGDDEGVMVPRFRPIAPDG
jgi:uncharacterized OB-fold protein